jgi:hypothetical protein
MDCKNSLLKVYTPNFDILKIHLITQIQMQARISSALSAHVCIGIGGALKIKYQTRRESATCPLNCSKLTYRQMNENE